MTIPLSDNGLLLASTILSIGSLLFDILLLVAYLSKEKLNNVRSKLYVSMIVITLILVVSELFEVFVIINYYDTILLEISYRIHWSTGIFLFSAMYYYSIVFIFDIKSNNIMDIVKKNKTTKIMSVFFIISLVIFLILPFDFTNVNSPYMSYTPGWASYYLYFFCAVTSAMVFIHLLTYKDIVETRKRAAVWITIVILVVVFFIQLAFVYIAVLAIGVAIQLYLLYFNIENPDLFMIEELEEINTNIDRSNRAKTDFLSNMSNEIKTPMNAIIDYSKSLIDSSFDADKTKKSVKNISLAGNNLLDIVNNILDISKIESGKEVLELREYSLSNVVMELSSIVEARLSEKQVQFIIDVDPKIPSKLYGDPTKLLQIMLNILSNSVKYTEVGRIKLSITGKINGDNFKLHIKISDTGYGIKQEDFDKLFEKFTRLDNATENEIDGTGLGLVITKKYVDLLGGKIWFESEFRAGTIFYVDLEQRIINSEPIGDIYKPVEEVNKELLDCSGRRVLLVDDNKLNLVVASRLLSKYKFEVVTVNSAKECIYKVKAEEHFDMIFLDHMMPEMDGIEALHVMRKLEGYTLPPIVALTANAITGMREMYLREGFDEYLSKPINVSELDKLINKYFK